MMKTIFGIFENRANAEEALSELEDEGFNVKDISIIMKHQGEAQEIASSTGVQVGEGIAKGATTGAVVGGIAGFFIGVGAIAIPGIGALLVAGPLAAALGLTGAAATTVNGVITGVVAGGLLGGLVNIGIPEDRAREYEERIKQGDILLAIPSEESDVQIARSILEDHNATNIDWVTVRTSQSYEEEEHPHHQHFHGGDMRKHVSSHEDGHKHANPVQVLKYLKHVDYPASRDDLLESAAREGAGDTVLHTLEELPDEEFASPKGVTQALGNIE